MNRTVRDQCGYNAAVAKLIKRVRQSYKADREWSPTPKRKELDDIASRIDELVALLDANGSSQFDIEVEHDRKPGLEIGADGWPRPAERIGPSYKATVWHLQDLAESARRVADALPDPREKHALPFAALALLHLRYRYGFPRPTTYEAGPDVVELQRVCEEADIHVSSSQLRKALTGAFKQFDPHWCQYHIEDLFV